MWYWVEFVNKILGFRINGSWPLTDRVPEVVCFSFIYSDICNSLLEPTPAVINAPGSGYPDNNPDNTLLSGASFKSKFRYGELIFCIVHVWTLATVGTNTQNLKGKSSEGFSTANCVWSLVYSVCCVAHIVLLLLPVLEWKTDFTVKHQNRTKPCPSSLFLMMRFSYILLLTQSWVVGWERS